MLEELKKQVYEANMLLKEYNLITLTWGNASGIDREKNLIVIKPSGVDYDKLSSENMVVVDLLTGNVVEGNLNPSSDTPTHLMLYRNFQNISGVVHTHSRWATTMAQQGLSIPALGTTHADTFYGSIPCTRDMTSTEIIEKYEENTGNLIIETFKDIDPKNIPAVLVKNHGPFTWGKSPKDAVNNAVVLEEVSFMAWHNIMLDKNINSISQNLLDKHFLRKHGKNSYYGQK